MAYLGNINNDDTQHDIDYVCNGKDMNVYFSVIEGQFDKNFECWSPEPEIVDHRYQGTSADMEWYNDW